MSHAAGGRHPWSEQTEQKGTVIKITAKGTSGFIQPDTGEENIFFLPSACEGFRLQLPPEGTRVYYKPFWDAKIQKMKAEGVRPLKTSQPPWAWQSGGGDAAWDAKGSRPKKESSWSGWADGSSKGSGGKWGSKGEGQQKGDSWSKWTDGRSGSGKGAAWKSQADWQPQKESWSTWSKNGSGSPIGAPAPWGSQGAKQETKDLRSTWSDGGSSGSSSAPWASKEARKQPEKVQKNDDDKHKFHDGVIYADKGSYGFIRPDTGGEDIYVLSSHCDHFGFRIPAIGTRVKYWILVDDKGRWRAVNVHSDTPQASHGTGWDTAEAAAYAEPGETFTGTMDKDHGNFGFIMQDNGQDLMFVLPWCCEGGVLPAVGSRVVYSVVTDGKDPRPRADDVRLEHTSNTWWSRPSRAQAGDSCTGTFIKNRGTFGFIMPDSGEGTMFVHPSECPGFNKELPPLGTRVAYTVGVRSQHNGKLQAEKVYPEGHSQASEQLTGTFDKDLGNYGYIKQDNGNAPMFVLPFSCEGWGAIFPAVGTRVVYSVVTDRRSGRPRAENVNPESKPRRLVPRPPTEPPPSPVEPGAVAPRVILPRPKPEAGSVKPRRRGARGRGGRGGEKKTGTMARHEVGVGFITQDDSDAELFVAPKECPDGELPEVGTRLSYKKGTHASTGGPMAVKVMLQEEGEEGQHESDASHEGEEGTAEDEEEEEGKDEEKEEEEEEGKDEQDDNAEEEKNDEHVEEEQDHDSDAQEPDADACSDEGAPPASARPYRSREWTKVWHHYCNEHGEGVRDPAEHGAAFLRKFLDEVLMTGEDEEEEEEGDPPEELVLQVRRARALAPQVWNAYCDREVDGIRDPPSHNIRSLKHFLDDIYFYVARCSGEPDEPASKRRKTAD